MASRSVTEERSSEIDRAPGVTRAFFERATTEVAQDLLGRILAVRGGEAVRSVRVVETEAYVADDPANHAYRGRTRRNRSMFLGPGTLYVYRIHQVVCANLVTVPGEAVLLRAGEPLSLGMSAASGPGRFCRSLGIRLSDDGTDVVRSPRFFLSAARRRPGRVWIGPRVGIRRAADRPLRFAIANSPWVSRPRPGPERRAREESA